MTRTLLLRLAGPMQSWGTRSRFSYRDTEAEPSKSGVIGLVAAALGRGRDTPLGDLAALEMAVRIDQAGHLEVDYQTALDVAKADGSKPGTVLSWRSYLADASFLVALAGVGELLREAHQALRAPRWPLFLGRKGHVPGAPVYVANGLLEVTSPIQALRSFEWPRDGAGPVADRTAVVECGPGEAGDARLDVPLSFRIDGRSHGQRRVRRIMLTPWEVSP